VVGLREALKALEDKINARALVNHAHPAPAWFDLQGMPEKFPSMPHTHPIGPNE
jgi:hypothetical protein